MTDLGETLKRAAKDANGGQPRKAGSRPRTTGSKGASLPSDRVDGIIQQGHQGHQAQLAAIQGRIIDTQNEHEMMTVMMSHQVAQAKEELADLIDEYYGGLPDGWFNMTTLLAEVDTYLGDSYTHENKLKLQRGAFLVLAKRIQQSFQLGLAPITVETLPALVGFENTPALLLDGQ